LIGRILTQKFVSRDVLDKGLKQVVVVVVAVVVVVVAVVVTPTSRFINYNFFPSMNLLMGNSV